MVSLSFLSSSTKRPLWQGQLLVVLCVVGFSLLGIGTRTSGYLAPFWGANAVMLGLLLRNPSWGRDWRTWAYAYAAYALTDWLTGTAPFGAFGMAAANELGVAVGWWLFMRKPRRVRELQQSHSVLELLQACLVAALASAMVGGPLSWKLFAIPWWQAYAIWSVSEFAAFILTVPVFLVAARTKVWSWRRWWPDKPMDWHYALPLVTLIASEVVALAMKGPGTLGFSVPAMIWYAMAYGVRPTVLLNLVLSLWKMLSISMGSFTFSLADINDVTSLRLGVALLSLAPLTVACTYALRQQSLHQLRQLVDYDALTGALSRRALLERGGKLLQRMRGEGQPMVLLMIDLDYFKQVNDLYGHANGDKVLQAFVRSTQAVLRPEDVLGRMGGEEFVVILPRTALAQAQRVAQRIGDQLRQLEIVLEGNNVIGVTCSIGVAAITQWDAHNPLELHLSFADHALYQAKAAGRDCVRLYQDPGR